MFVEETLECMSCATSELRFFNHRPQTGTQLAVASAMQALARYQISVDSGSNGSVAPITTCSPLVLDKMRESFGEACVECPKRWRRPCIVGFFLKI